MRRHLGVDYSWEEDGEGPNVVVKMKGLIKEIIDLTKEYVGEEV